MLDVAERTVYRDIERLRNAGVPIDFDDQTRGYAIRRDFFLRPIDLTLDEALAHSILTDRLELTGDRADAGRHCGFGLMAAIKH